MIRDAWRKIKGGGASSTGERPGLKPENLVWVFGTARTGSSWLSAMMGEMGGCSRWHEPLVGHLFGNLYYVRAGHRSEDEHFILGARYRELWLGMVRNFVLDSAAARFPEVAGGRCLIVKEPQGSVGAPLLIETLPESRMILLARDPRDVVASNLDAHRGRKVLIKYEDLRADTLGTIKRIYSDLEISVDEGELARSVEKHSWENIPEEEKGEGKFHRKATPGGWREDLTPEQVEIVERVAGPLLGELYPVRSTA